MSIDDLSIFTDNPRYDEDNPNEGYFSWYACDCCDERLGGQRYDIAVSYTHLTLPTKA